MGMQVSKQTLGICMRRRDKIQMEASLNVSGWELAAWSDAADSNAISKAQTPRCVARVLCRVPK